MYYSNIAQALAKTLLTKEDYGEHEWFV